MATTNINISTDSELAARVQSVLADMGLDMSAVVNSFLTQMVDRKSLAAEMETTKKKVPLSELRGCMKIIRMADDFDAPLEEMREYME